MKNKRLFEAILIVLSIVVIYVLVRKNYVEIAHSIIHANIYWILLAILFYILYLVLQAIPFYYFTRLYNKNVSFKFFVYLVIVTNFFNGITPLATGGQPLQVYEIHKKNVSVVNATNIVIQNGILFNLAIVIWTIVAIIINRYYHLIRVTPMLRNMATIGIILNMLFLAVLLLIGFSKKFNKKLINAVIWLLSKLHIVKNPEKQRKKWDKSCNDFYENSKVLMKHKGMVFGGIITLLIAFIFYYSIPLCIAKALNCAPNLTIVTTLVISSYAYLSSNYLPVPGATGGIEYAFLGYFKQFVRGYKLNALLIIWRTLTYYLPTIIGGFIFNIHSLSNSNQKDESN